MKREFSIANFNFLRGQTLIEILLAMGLAALIFPTLLAAFMSTREGRPQQEARLQAIALLKETEQAVKSVRSNGWDSLAGVATNTPYHPEISGSVWTLVSGTTTLNGFTQSVVISDVERNSSGDIVASGGTVDPSTKKVEITISWAIPQISNITTTTYFTRSENQTFTHTVDTDFETGTLEDTQITNTSGGEILLANNNKGKWCEPAFSSSAVDLPDGPPVAVDARASTTSIDIPNDIFVATSPNTSTSIKFAYVTATANEDPPTTATKGIFTLDSAQYSNPSYVPTGIDLDNSFKTNDIKYYQSSSGKKYALLATDLPDKEVIAVLVDDNNSANDEDTTGEFVDPVNNIYKYWTYFNTRMYDGSPQATGNTGLLGPTANIADTGGDNNGYESNPQEAYTDDNDNATDNNSGTGSSTECTGTTEKDRHQYYNYDISLDSGTTISGIEVVLEDAGVNSLSGSPDPKTCIELSWDGGTTWTTAKSQTYTSTSDRDYSFGGSSDTWGRTWGTDELSNTNFRVRVTNVAEDTSRDFRVDWIAVRVHYPSQNYDQSPYDYGGTTLAVLGNRGYVASGGYLYVFDLSDIDSKSSSDSLDLIGCRIEMDGYECRPGSPATAEKYIAGETGGTWSSDTSAIHNDCSDGGNIELYATNDIYPVEVSGSTYVFTAVGGVTNPEFAIVNATSVPDSGTTPSISNNSCGRISGGNSGWQRVSTYDFNSSSGTEEAANSVFAKSDGTRAYITSNGGADSEQYYILNTENKSSPAFLSGSSSTGPTSGYYNSSGANGELYPRRALTVQDGVRAVLVGKDGVSNATNAEEYQVLDNSTEATPTYCGGLDFDTGFNDLTSASELDGDNYLYMVANSTDNALKIIQGGPDNAIFVAEGTYESPTYDALNSSAFNSFNATVSQPASTTLQLQVATAPPVSGSCTGATFSFVGPGGDPGQYFTPSGSALSGAIPFGNYVSNAYQNPGRCFRYKLWMGSDNQTQTPVFYDFTANYSP